MFFASMLIRYMRNDRIKIGTPILKTFYTKFPKKSLVLELNKSLVYLHSLKFGRISLVPLLEIENLETQLLQNKGKQD